MGDIITIGGNPECLQFNGWYYPLIDVSEEFFRGYIGKTFVINPVGKPDLYIKAESGRGGKYSHKFNIYRKNFIGFKIKISTIYLCKSDFEAVTGMDVESCKKFTVSIH